MDLKIEGGNVFVFTTPKGHRVSFICSSGDLGSDNLAKYQTVKEMYAWLEANPDRDTLSGNVWFEYANQWLKDRRRSE